MKTLNATRSTLNLHKRFFPNHFVWGIAGFKLRFLPPKDEEPRNECTEKSPKDYSVTQSIHREYAEFHRVAKYELKLRPSAAESCGCNEWRNRETSLLKKFCNNVTT